MADLDSAVAYVNRRGNPVEQARLNYLLRHELPSRKVIDALLAGQQPDGGWPLFGASSASSGPASSLDTTCFHLAKANQMGLEASEPAITRAVEFLAQRQRADGNWEEDAALASLAPPWAKPGDEFAMLYLTAICGFWLAVLVEGKERASRAASYLYPYLDVDDGRLPSFLHTHWLAGGLWYRLGLMEPAGRVFGYLAKSLKQEIPASNLAWLINSLCIAGVPTSYHLVEMAASLLEKLQSKDGSWPSEDGLDFDVHSTLDAISALQLCGRF